MVQNGIDTLLDSLRSIAINIDDYSYSSNNNYSLKQQNQQLHLQTITNQCKQLFDSIHQSHTNNNYENTIKYSTLLKELLIKEQHVLSSSFIGDYIYRIAEIFHKIYLYNHSLEYLSILTSVNSNQFDLQKLRAYVLTLKIYQTIQHSVDHLLEKMLEFIETESTIPNRYEIYVNVLYYCKPPNYRNDIIEYTNRHIEINRDVMKESELEYYLSFLSNLK